MPEMELLLHTEALGIVMVFDEEIGIRILSLKINNKLTLL
jgi:hypothetical protein